MNVSQTLPLRGRRSRNKVSVGEPAEGSFMTVSDMPFLLALGNLIKHAFSLVWLVNEGSTETNVSAQWSMKGAVSCDKQCDVQPPVNHGRPGVLGACH